MWKQRALGEGCVEGAAVRSWSAGGSHRRGALRRTGRRGRRTGTRDTGSRRWRVSRRARIGRAHGVCTPCAPGKWCTSGRRAGQYAKWDASFLAGVRFYHIGNVRDNIARAICVCCFAVHTPRAVATSTYLLKLRPLTPVLLDVIVCPANRRCVHASGPGWRSLYGKPCSSFHRTDPPGFHRPAGGHGNRAAPGPCERRSRLGRANLPGCHFGERATIPSGIDADLPRYRHANLLCLLSFRLVHPGPEKTDPRGGRRGNCPYPTCDPTRWIR